MKNLIKSVVMAFGAMALVSACEAAGGSDTSSTTGTDNGGNTTGTDGVDGTTGTPAAGEYPAIEIQDDPSNQTLSPTCDTGSLKSPGADIDAAQLGAGSYLASCEASGSVGCESTAGNVSDAQGSPNSDGGEASGQYYSLNGGKIRCNWSGGTIIKDTDDVSITVYEVGKAGSGVAENYTVRVCKSTGGNCSKDANYSTGESEFPVSALF